jgi:hypothetical protein
MGSPESTFASSDWRTDDDIFGDANSTSVTQLAAR